MKFSVIVPAFNARETLSGLLVSLAAQTFIDFETIIVDDASTDGSPDLAARHDCTLIRLDRNRGPAWCRNRGAEAARGDILVFTDSDCRVAPDWLESIARQFSTPGTDAVMGRLVINPANTLGRAIANLGFPAGGTIGFHKLWRVDSRGHTHSLSTCNCALRRPVFECIGGFDTTFPYPGGEDSLLAYRLIENGHRIRYCTDIVAFHPARDTLRGFGRWQFRRGISSLIFASKVRRRRKFVGLRLWSTTNILRHAAGDRLFPLVLMLLLLSFGLQTAGLLFGRLTHSRRRYRLTNQSRPKPPRP